MVKWHGLFGNGCISIEDDERCGHSSSLRQTFATEVHKMLDADIDD